jgi:hypothetical protein
MKWKKLGKIFDPRDFDLPNGCLDFAQSPQALVFDDFVRIYFSARQKDPRNDKYLSHVSFVDMKKNFKEIVNVANHTVIALGKLGCFDEHGIFPMNVIRRKDEIYGYTCGWNRKVSVSVDTSIGLAISNDNGLTFRKMGDGPILTSSLHEPFLVGDPFVQTYEGKFHMWHMFGTGWKKFSPSESPDRIYKIGHAISEDGVTWEKEEGRQIISDRLNSDESQALPTVIKLGDRYHMWFCYRESSDFRRNKSRGYRIGYAFSDDLVDWTRDDGNVGIDVSEDGWDSEMMCYPHVFEWAGKIYLLYNGNEFGRYGFGAAVLE